MALGESEERLLMDELAEPLSSPRPVAVTHNRNSNLWQSSVMKLLFVTVIGIFLVYLVSTSASSSQMARSGGRGMNSTVPPKNVESEAALITGACECETDFTGQEMISFPLYGPDGGSGRRGSR